jgi:hypothetical protein
MFNIWLRLATRSRPSSRLLSKALGFIHWHFRPRLGGAHCSRGAIVVIGGEGLRDPRH